MTIYAQHVSYQLNGVVVLPFTASGIQDALSQLSAYAPEFTFSSNNDSTVPFTVSAPTSLRSLLGGTEGSLLDVYGGEYHFDGWNITFDRARGTDRGALDCLRQKPHRPVGGKRPVRRRHRGAALLPGPGGKPHYPGCAHYHGAQPEL